MLNGDGLESLDGRMMRGPFEWQRVRWAETAEPVNGEVLEILERLIKVTLAFR
jgi:hypothetical protein